MKKEIVEHETTVCKDKEELTFSCKHSKFCLNSLIKKYIFYYVNLITSIEEEIKNKIKDLCKVTCSIFDFSISKSLCLWKDSIS